jgi:protein gp37
VGDKSAIQWTDATWNPTTGCDRVSPGCANCYALTLAPRLQGFAKAKGAPPTAPYMRDGDPKTSGVGFGLMLHPDRLDQPLRWQKPRRIFTNSMSDLFHPEVPDEFLDRVFAVMALAKQHTFQVLTKRPERMREYVPLALGRIADTIIRMRRARGDHDVVVPLAHVPLGVAWWPLPNVWLGTSVENARWRTRIDELRQTPAAVRFLSCEPLVGPLVCPECHGWGYDVVGDPSDPSGQTPMQVQCPGPAGWHGEHRLDLDGIHWAITGGESGPGSRPLDEAWLRDIRDACAEQGVAFFNKQMGRVWAEEHLGNAGHAGDIERFPEDLRVREYPS